MNGLRCPKCGLVNLLSAKSCHRCGHEFAETDASAEVSVPAQETFQARNLNDPEAGSGPVDSETGRKTFFWYKIYCGVMLALYAVVTILGVVIAVFSGEAATVQEQEEALITGIVYAVIGPILGLIYLIALFLPRKPYNWIYGIVMIGIGLTSCCFWPATIPLLIFWLKPETKAYLGRT